VALNHSATPSIPSFNPALPRLRGWLVLGRYIVWVIGRGSWGLSEVDEVGLIGQGVELGS
jgi:hypothetical protein